jgi:beta-lactamase class A
MNDKEYRGRKTLTLFFFMIFFLVLGRNLSFLPKFDFSLHQKTDIEKTKQEVEKLIKDKPGFYSVYYKDLKTGESFGINEKQIQTAASVNKVPIVAAVYYLDSKAKLSLDDKITVQKEDIQDYGTGSIRYQKPGQNYSIRNLSKLALNISDNTAAHVLGVRIGTDVLQNLVDTWKLSQTNMQGNATTLIDMEKLFEDIWNGKLASSAKTQELLSFMTNTDIENRLPKDLPKTAKVYHKTGDGEGFIHDVGIFQDGDNVYFLGVMTSDVGNNDKLTQDTIAKISKIVYSQYAEK